MLAWLGAAVALSAALAVRADGRGARRQVYVFKPLTTLLVLAACFAAEPVTEPAYRWLIAAGLACSLAGDVFLMLPRDRFVAGLASFLAAHLFYLAAFTRGVEMRFTAWAFAPYALATAALLALLFPHLGKLKAPVVVYAAALAAMAWLAAERWIALGTAQAAGAALGGALFVVSDATLATNRFARPFRAAQPVVLATYWAAQWLIATSV